MLQSYLFTYGELDPGTGISVNQNYRSHSRWHSRMFVWEEEIRIPRGNPPVWT